MNTTLLEILNDACKDENKRFDYLKIAIDFAQDNKLPEKLIYALKWMYLNKKFPKVTVHKRSYKDISGFDKIKNKIEEELLEKVKNNLTPKSLNTISGELADKIKKAKKEYMKGQPKHNIEYYRFSFTVGYIDNVDNVVVESNLPEPIFNWNYYLKFKTMQETIEFVVERLNLFMRYFPLELK